MFRYTRLAVAATVLLVVSFCVVVVALLRGDRVTALVEGFAALIALGLLAFAKHSKDVPSDQVRWRWM
ncbi:MAG: hypothetical protein QOH16_3115 [Gaiellaceae bacterium]|nr:hypothetical protein [Gaiellaceae bacterium]